MMIDEDEDGGFREFATLLKGHPKGMHGNNFFYHKNIRGKGFHNRNRSRDEGFFGQELACDEAFGSNTVGHRKGWRHGNTSGFHPARKESNNIHSLPHKNNAGFPRIHTGHHFGFGVHDNGHNQQNAQRFGDRFHGKGHVRNYVRGGFAGRHTYGGGFFRRPDSNHNDADNLPFHRERSNLQPNSGCKQVKNKVFTSNHGKRGGRAHCFRGSYKRVARSGITEVLQYESNKVIVSDPSPMDAGLAKQLECKKAEDICSIQSPQANKVDVSDCKESEVQGTCPIQSPASNSCSQSPALCRGESQQDGVSPQKDSMIGFGDQKQLERAFISCSGGTKKRRRSLAVRDFPVLSGRLHNSSVKKVIIKSKGTKAKDAKDLVLEDSVRAGSQSDLTVANEITRVSNEIIVPADHVGPELTMRDCSKPHLGMVDGPSDLVMSDPETTCEVATKIIVEEGNSSAELTEVGFEEVVENCCCLTLTKGNDGNEHILETGEIDVKVAGPEESSGVIEADVPELTNQSLNGKDTRYFENSSEIPSVLTHAKIPEASDVATIVSRQTTSQGNSLDGKDTQFLENSSEITSDLTHANILEASDVATVVSRQPASQGNEHSRLKERKKTWRTDMQAVGRLRKSKSKANKVLGASTDGSCNHCHVPKKLKVEDSLEPTTEMGALVPYQSADGGEVKTNMQAVGGLLKSKFKPNKVSGALTDGLHDHSRVPKKLKVEDSLELTKEVGALVPYQSADGGNVRNMDFRKRLPHKGSHRAKLFQTSKSFDPNDAAKLSALEASEGVSDRALVKRTLHEFESIRKALVKSQNAVKRADLDAGALLREKGKWRNCKEKIVGEVPGVEVGDQFSFRMEMHIIGLHRQIQAGIDYIPGTRRPSGSPLATSIVSSGGYEDDRDDGNTLIYSGHGGNNIKGNKKQESNQELVRGNLALTNSMKEKTPVRVIRGTTDLASPSSKVYTYDGLYDVVNYAFECGVAGFWVYQFTLTRRPGQPQVGLSFLTNLKKKGLSRPNLLLNDISRGQERLPVCVVNEVDEEPAPLHFSYIPSIKYPIWYSPLLPQGCQCTGVCDEETCSCAVKNGGEFPYNEKGYIVRDKKVLYECGPSCSCSSSCMNRVSQKGLRYRLEIFKTKNRGWGVRSLDSIQPGGFICEYTGELLSDAEAEQRVENDEYLFELGNDCNPFVIESDLANANSNLAMVPFTADVAYTIDAKDLGNVARFINHSCSPNLYAQNVLYDSDDLRFPHVMLFAMENIPPMRELTYDYNYSIDHVRDAHGNVKMKACYCGAQDCQGRLY